jgi:hypothetical protein
MVVLGALTFSVLFFAAYGRQSTLSITPDEGQGFPATGFYPTEQGPGFTFAWTGPTASLAFPGLDRRIAWRWSATAHASHPAGVEPTVQLAVDGLVQATVPIANATHTLDVVLPPAPSANGGTVTIHTSPPFVPGPNDRRELGMALEAISLTPLDGAPRPPLRALVLGAAATATLAAMLVLMGVPRLGILAAIVGVSGAEVALLLRGAAAHGPFPTHLAYASVAVALGCVLCSKALEWWRSQALSTAARSALALSALACVLKLLVQLHPLAPPGDGIFHAHRFENVLAGHFFFTSIAPGNYSFPYPVLLYVVAAPFSFLAHSTIERAVLLRVVVTVADAGAAALLYWMVVRRVEDRAAGLWAVAWYHAVPMTAWIMTWGNLTNAFGQCLFVASLAALVAIPVARGRGPIAVLVVLATGALLSHPSTCAILAIVLAVTAGLYWLRGARPLRDAARGVATATIAASALAVVLYYAWFPTLYVRELTRIWSESGTHLAAATPALPMSVRLAQIPQLASSYLGWPAMLSAGIGAWRMRTDCRDPRLTWLLAGWIGACVLFQLLGVVTPVQMRTFFALFPALAVAAAFACAWAWRGGRVSRACVVLVCGVGAWLGVVQWAGLFG